MSLILGSVRLEGWVATSQCKAGVLECDIPLHRLLRGCRIHAGKVAYDPSLTVWGGTARCNAATCEIIVPRAVPGPGFA
jgi:hypothetical protein